MKTVILCGGLGTRLREETEFRPKPMVEIGPRPILWHIMKMYAHYGFKDFILCLGYKGEMIKEYFYNYPVLNNDFTVELNNHRRIDIHRPRDEDHWKVTLADTGKHAMTGARIKRVEKYIDSDVFMLSYGDGVSDIKIDQLLEYHLAHGKIGTVTGVTPVSRYGKLETDNNRVTSFSEKPHLKDSLINGGFFVFNRRFFDYLQSDDDCVLEKQPLENLSRDGELMVYSHCGFWKCMDTFRDMQALNGLWETESPAWKVWDGQVSVVT